MVRPAILVLGSLLVFALLISGCGGTATMNGAAVSTRELESITVAPSAADARMFPNSQVQFTATGMFNMTPSSVMSMPVMWSVGDPSFMSPTPMPMSMRSSIFASSSGSATISGTGLAQCNGFVGIVTIEATAPADPNTPLSQMNSMMSVVTGRASMKCP